jgi:hypothetical protein
LGAVRMLATGWLDRVAVLAEHRRRGTGRQLLEAVIAYATDLGLPRISVSSPERLQRFFHGCGFRASGSANGTVERVEMALELPIPYAKTDGPVDIVNPSTDSFAQRPSQLLTFESEHDCCRTIALLLEDARRTIVLHSPNLEPEMFASEACLKGFRQFSRRRRSQLQILVEDAKSIAAAAHPLLELARRLPSKVQLRRLPSDHVPSRRDFMVVDEEAVWIRPDTDAFVGWANPHDRVEARRLVEEFNWLFQRSTDDPDFRLLNL